MVFKVQTPAARRKPYLPIHLATLLAYLLLTSVMTWPLACQWTTAIPGDGFDGWQNYWNQWWIKVALVDRLQNPFHTDLLYYPTGVDLYFHTLNPFNGITTLPIQLSGGLIQAYNAVVLLSWVLAGYGVYLLVLWLLQTSQSPISNPQSPIPKFQSPISNYLAAFIAGAIFTFAPFHMAHLLGHMQVMSLEWIPFYVLYLLRALDGQRKGKRWRRAALMAGFFLTLTGLCDWYFVLYLFFFTGLVCIGEVISRHNAMSRRLAALWPPLVAGLLMLILLSPLLIPMVRAASQFTFMVRPTSDLYILSASVLDFLIPNRLHTLFRPASFTWPGNQIAPVSERTIAIGYMALALALVATSRLLRKQPQAKPDWWSTGRLWLCSALFFFLLALGPNWHWATINKEMVPAPDVMSTSWTPFGLLNATIPFMRISRSVSRYALMVQLSVAVLAGLGTATLLQRLNGGAGARRQKEGAALVALLPTLLATTAILAVILFESWVAPFPMSPPDTPAVYAQLPTLVPELSPTDAILNVPMNYDRPGYLLYQTVHHHPLTVAYISRDDPRTLTERVPLLQHFRHLGPDILLDDPLVVGPTVLHDLGIKVVIQDRYKMPGGLERDYTEGLANALFADRSPRYTDDRITLQVVPPLEGLQPYLMLGALHWGPLTIAEDGTRRRLIGQAAAALHIQHGTPTLQLRLRYRSVVGDELSIFDGNGTTLVEKLPPAPDGNEVMVPLNGAETIWLHSSTTTGIWIEAAGLVTPSPS